MLYAGMLVCDDPGYSLTEKQWSTKSSVAVKSLVELLAWMGTQTPTDHELRPDEQLFMQVGRILSV